MRRFDELIPSLQMAESQQLQDFAVDGIVPDAVVFPSTVEEVSEVVKIAASNNVSLIPRGNGTKLTIGNVPKKIDIIISLLKLNKILEYTPEDLTVSIEAGMTLKQLQNVLSRNNQFLPLDPYFTPSATLGGIQATNSSGPSRLVYGTPRDMILGAKVVNADGKITKTGGKVVKNVAGYALGRLYTGSYGTLAVLVNLTYKVQPIPDKESLVLVSFESREKLIKATWKILDSDASPHALEAFNPHALLLLAHEGQFPTPKGPYLLAVILAGTERGVRERLRSLEMMKTDMNTTEFQYHEKSAKDDFWVQVASIPTKAVKAGFDIRCRIDTLPSNLGLILQEIHEVAAGKSLKAGVHTRAGNGVVYLYFSSHPDPDSIIIAISELREFLSGFGILVIENAPLQVKKTVDVWGEPPNGFDLMKKIKGQFDPNCILNPGRFVGGL